MSNPSDLVQNRLLACMGPELFARLRPQLERVRLNRRTILQDHNRRIEHIYFIEKGVASVFARTRADGPVEVAIVGRVGLVGVAVVLGTARSPNRCIMETPGEALRIDAKELQQIMKAIPAVRDHLLKYVHALLVQNTQTALCNARHEIQQRLCRWLLLASERVDESTMPLTHEQLAIILGVRRAGITTTLSALEENGAVNKSRGWLQIADRVALERRSCECYSIISAEYRRITDGPCHQHRISRQSKDHSADSACRTPIRPAS